MLVFTQQMGLRLWLHNVLHQAHVAQSSEHPTQVKPLQCSCIDEALMPMDAPLYFQLSVPQRFLVTNQSVAMVYHMAPPTYIRSLRAPPVVI